MIPRFKPTLGFDELKACLSFLKKDDIRRFENDFAALMGQKYALAFPYGRTGLILLLEALGLENKEIICPAYTCVVVPHAIVYSNNIPVFVDCEPDGFNMDLDQVVKKINPRTGAIIATSLFGYPVDLDRLNKIRSHHPHIHIIQDCAHSFSAEWKGRPVQKEGVASLFGLNISKVLTSIFGGMITTDCGKLYRCLKKHRDRSLQPAGRKKNIFRMIYFAAIYPAFWKPLYSIVNSLENSGILDNFTRYFDENKIDMPPDYQIQMSGVEAKVGMVQIKKYHDIIQMRRKYSAYYYSSAIKDIEGISVFKMVEGANNSHIIALSENREIILKKALKRGLQLGSIIDYCIPNMPAYKKFAFYDEDYPIAEYYAEHIINLPVSGEFNMEIANDVVQILYQICLEAKNCE